jgi:hypothetical protein
MANTTIYNLPALNTVDSTSLFPLSSNGSGTPTTYQASIGNIGNAITGNLRLTGDNITSTNNTINISADSNVWNFNANGNLTLPGLYGAQLIVNQLGGPGLFTGGATAQPSLNYGDLSNVFVGDNIVLTTDSGNNTWTFGTTGYLQVPSNASQPGPGTIAAANGYPTILAYGSGGGMGIHGGPELDWMDADDPANNFGNASVLRNTMYLNGGGLYIGINENNVDGYASPNWRFDPGGNLNVPGSIYGPADSFFDIKVIDTGPGASLQLGDWDVAGFPKSLVQISDNVHIVTGVTTGGGSWTFDTAGNLTLPANTFAVNYANGTQVSLGSGNANTGNVTFNDQVVIGTGTDSGAGGLYLAPGTNSTANLQYLRVRGGDYPTHIHLDTGNNAYYDQYFGDDYKFIVLHSGGNILINTNDLVGNTAQWDFGPDGNLNAPGYIVLDAGTDGNIDSTGNVNIISNSNTWTFGSDGEFYLPTGGRIGATKGGTMLDGGNGSLASLTSFYSNGFYSACFTAQPDGNAYITTYPGSGSNVWQFGVDGNTTFPSDGNVNLGNFILATHANFVVSAFIGNSSANIFLNYDGSGNFSGNLTSANANLGNLATANYVNVASNLVTSNLSVNLDFSGNTANFTGNITAINANLGNLATANYVNVASNVVTSNLSVNLDFSGNTANFTGNITAINANLGNIAIANYFSTSGTGGDITLTNGNISGANVLSVNTIQLTTVAIANLPSATTPGLKAFVSDSNIAPLGNFGVVVSNGGANYTTVFSDGSNWLIG